MREFVFKCFKPSCPAKHELVKQNAADKNGRGWHEQGGQVNETSSKSEQCEYDPWKKQEQGKADKKPERPHYRPWSWHTAVGGLVACGIPIRVVSSSNMGTYTV